MGKRLEIQLYNARTGESITLPLNPETTDIPTEKDIKTYDILDFGEISVKGTKRLKRINLANILPDSNSSLSLLASLIRQLRYRPYDLQETIDMINRWIDNDEIVRVIIGDKLNAEFRVQKLVESVHESVSDVHYSLDLIEYINLNETIEQALIRQKIETEIMTPKIVKLKKRAINKFIPNEVVAKKGMTVYKLAKLTYGGRFQELANLNAIINQNADITGMVVEMLPLK